MSPRTFGALRMGTVRSSVRLQLHRAALCREFLSSHFKNGYLATDQSQIQFFHDGCGPKKVFMFFGLICR